MATTIVPPLKAGHDARLVPLYDAYVRAQGDSDKAGDMEDAAYYEGVLDGLRMALVAFGGFDPEPETGPSA